MQKIENDIDKLLRRAGVSGDITLTKPPNLEMGDLAFACFDLAKAEKKNPVEVAKNIHNTLRKKRSTIVERVQCNGPYVNFFLSTATLGRLIVRDIEKRGSRYGSTKIGKRQKILIEYPSNNTHKEFHVGHLRNICIGNTLVELYKKNGFRVIPVNYLNDFGAHVVRCLWGIKKFHAGEVPPENKQKWLGDIYAEASRYTKEHPEETKDELDALQTQLEARRSSIWKLFLETRQWSMDGIHALFRELGVNHTHEFYEKDVKARGQEIVDSLLKRGIAKIGEGGAVIVDLTTYKLDIALLRKSTGAGLYLTSDLALAEKKFKKFPSIKESLHITGMEQNFYFQQLFQVLRLSGFAGKMTHIGYGLVNTKTGKMSSRSGNVILYEEIRDDVRAAIERETKARHSDWDEEQSNAVIRTLTDAVLKFTLQKHESGKNIIFDLEEAVSFDGFTAPYILYAVARMNSILRKSEVRDLKSETAGLGEPEEKKLLLLLAQYSGIIEKALIDYNPSTVTRYCFDVAQAFNEFYNTHRVLDAEENIRCARLSLIQATRTVLTDALRLLTIDTVEEM